MYVFWWKLKFGSFTFVVGATINKGRSRILPENHDFSAYVLSNTGGSRMDEETNQKVNYLFVLGFFLQNLCFMAQIYIE